MITTLPNLLSLSRIIAVPALIAASYLPGDLANWVMFGLFAAASLTDFFDGYIARTRGQQSRFGRFLDPVADKLLVAACIVMLVAVDRIGGATVIAAIIILCREILVSGLREFLAGISISVPVSRLAKWKTTLQMVALALLLIGAAAPLGIPAAAIGSVALWIAALLTLYTGYDYVRTGLPHVIGRRPAEKPAETLAEPDTTLRTG